MAIRVDVGLQRVPVLVAVHVQMRRFTRQPLQRIGELAGGLSGLNAPQHHRLQIHTSLGVGPGRRAHVDRAGGPAGGRQAPEVRRLVVDTQRHGVRTVHIGLDDGVPAILQVLLHLADERAGVHGQVGGHDQQRPVAALPELRDGERHQPQHAAGALELVQCRPIAEEPVEQLGMDRVRQLHPPPVLELAHARREVAGSLHIHLAERADDAVAHPRPLRRDRIEQPSPHDLERLVRRRRLPLRRRAGDHVLEPLQRRATPIPTHLDVRRGDRHQHDDVRHRRGGLGERLGECELRVEVAAGQAPPPVTVAELAGIGHPLVDQHHRRAEQLEQFAQRRTGVCARLVVGTHQLVAVPAAQLVGQMAPHGAHFDTVFHGLRRRWGDHRAGQHCSGHPVGQRNPRLVEHVPDPRQVLRRHTRGQVIQGDHAVGLAAAEIRLQFDDGIAATARQPPRRPHQQIPQTLGQIGAGEELPRVLVLRVGSALQHLEQVGGELRLIEASRRNVSVRRDDLPPRRQTRLGLTLGGFRRCLATLGAGCLLEHLAQQVMAEISNLAPLVEVAEGFEHALHRVERPQRVVARERPLVRPLVADIGHFEYQRSNRRREPVTEHLVPGALDALEQERRVAHLRALHRTVQPAVDCFQPARAEEPLPSVRALRPQPVAQEVERTGYALFVGHHHRFRPLISVGPRVRSPAPTNAPCSCLERLWPAVVTVLGVVVASRSTSWTSPPACLLQERGHHNSGASTPASAARKLGHADISPL